MGSVLFSLLLVSIPALVLLHLFVAPYTKVEESFHIQAIHDILSYGIPTTNISETLRAKYDHFTFPGSVPRTFIGAIFLSGLSQPIIWLNGAVNRQMLARAVLGLFNAAALASYASGVRKAFGQTTAVWYLLFQVSQFHVIYYASRTLSNMFAFGITTVAMRFLLPEPISPVTYRKRCKISMYLLTVAGIVFRSEIALFLATHTVFLFFTGRIIIKREIIPAGVLGLLVGLTSTVLIDSFFWQQFPLWPELTAFKFNVLAGQSSAWGSHPWHFYFANAIPRLLLNPLTYIIGIPVALLTPSTRFPAASIALPSLLFVAIYSIQPHKEWRFIVYTVPPLTTAAALGASYIWNHRTKSLMYSLLSLFMILSTLASLFLSTFVLLPASSANYPGAQALRVLHDDATKLKPEISVYLGNLACQTGVTRFTEIPPQPRLIYNADSIPTIQTWHYDKTEDETVKSSPSFYKKFDYILIEPGKEENKLAHGSASEEHELWVPFKDVEGFAGLRVLRSGDEAEGEVEGRILGAVVGSRGPRLWASVRDFARRVVTRGWWVEVRMEPKIYIFTRIGYGCLSREELELA